MRRKICHITTVHNRFDVRIFHKECKSLSKEFKVFLIVADGLGDEEVDDVSITDIGKRQGSRLKRFFIDSKKAFIKAVELNCEIYHFHDPELIRIGIKLLKKNKKVIYDVHEDVPRQILGKAYLNKFIKPIISRLFEFHENAKSKKFSYIITATPYIKKRFLKINKNTEDINNYPILESEMNKEVKQDDKAICYIGGISKIRGIYEITEALRYTDVTLHLAGKFETEDVRNNVYKMEGSKKIAEYGYVGREKINEVLAKSILGLVTLHPVTNYLDSLPVKMFEYMSAGIPVVASDFPLWKNILEDANCGICVDPLDPKKIAEAVNFLINNKEIAKQMGENGKRAVVEKYNWSAEKIKLLEIYNILEQN